MEYTTDAIQAEIDRYTKILQDNLTPDSLDQEVRIPIECQIKNLAVLQAVIASVEMTQAIIDEGMLEYCQQLVWRHQMLTYEKNVRQVDETTSDASSIQKIDSVWDAIEDTPEEAENMKLRSILMMELKAHLARNRMSQAQAAKLFGVTQPRVSDLMRGKINLFGIDSLVNMARAANLQVSLIVVNKL